MCCDCECAQHKKEATLVFTPYSERSCTDLLFLLLFVGMWVAVIAIFSSAATKGGDPDKLLRGVDYLGRVCGKDSGVLNQQYAAWPSVLDYNVKLCVENCDATQTDTRFFINYETNLYFYYCLPFPDVDLNFTIGDDTDGSDFWEDESSFSTGEGDSDVDSPSQVAARAMGDLYTTYPVILISGFVALILSYFYAELVKYIGGCIVWTSLLLIVAGGFLLGYAFLYAADVTQAEQPEEASTAVQVERALGWFSIAATVVFLLMICFLRKRISMAIEVVKEASRAINDMRALVCVPVFPFLFAMLYTFFWCVVALYIFSVTVEKEYPIPDSLNPDYSIWIDPPYPYTYTELEWDKEMQNSFALIFFHMLWQVEFLIYFCYLVVAGAIANWYFTPRDDKGEKIRGDGIGQLPEDAITQSVKRTCRFHLGSICFGALIIAIIKFCRAVVTYIQMKTKHKQNFLMKCGFYCVQCCLKCIDCCCDKISKNAYVWIAIYGHGYLTSACSAFSLVWSNLARLAAIELVGELILHLGKVMIALMTTGVCGVFIFAYYRDAVSNISMPCFVIFMLSYLVATLFMVVFDTTIDTVFLCFLVDEKHNKGTGQMLASKELCDLVDKYGEESRKHAALRKGEPSDGMGLTGEAPGGPINKA